MKFSGYIGGLIGLTKDAVNFVVFLLKNPHYVIVLLACIIGIFYLNGIPPREISPFLESKWHAFVENRKQTFKEDFQLLSDHFGIGKGVIGKDGEIPDFSELSGEEVPKKQIQRKTEEEVRQELTEEVFGWQKAFQDTRPEEEPADEDAVQGVLFVVSADRISIGEKTYSLNVRLRSGKAGEAYQEMKRQFDGRKAKCVPDQTFPEKMNCFVGGQSVSEMLTDFGLADPI